MADPCDLCDGVRAIRTGPGEPVPCPACRGAGVADPAAPAYPRYRWVTVHRTSGEARQLVVETRPGVHRAVGEEVPVGPQGPTAGEVIREAGFRADGRPLPGGGQEVVLPAPRPEYPADASGPSWGQTHGGLNGPESFRQ
jgi:hypothetical protein